MARLAVPTQKRAALYPRVSDQAAKDADERGQETSLDTQLTACQRYAAERGYAVAPEHVFTEKHTGVELWERPQLTKLRAAVRAREVDVVIAYAIDRLSRDPVHLGVILTEADYAGVEVAFVTEPLDNSPEGQLVRFVRGYAAKVEHEKIKERTMRGKHARVVAGKILPGARPRYGYAFNADRTGFELDPATASVVLRMRDECLRGLPLRRICANLMADGVPTPGRSPRGVWLPGTVRNILTDSAYAGRPYAMRKKTHRAHGKTIQRLRPIDEQTALPSGVVPPLFTAQEQEAMVARLRANHAGATRNNRAPTEALLRAGHVRCGVCGTAMHVEPPHRTTPAHYRCNARNGLGTPCGRHSINVAKVDAAVWARVSDLLARPEIIARELDRLEETDTAPADTSAVERTVAGVERQIRTLVEQLAHLPVGGAVANAVLEKLSGLEQQQRALDEELVGVRARAASWRSVRARLDGLTAWCRRFAAQLGEMDYARRREAVYMLGVEVTVWPKEHPDTPADVDRYLIEASIPLDVPVAGDIVYRSCGAAIHNVLPLRWTDRSPAEGTPDAR